MLTPMRYVFLVLAILVRSSGTRILLFIDESLCRLVCITLSASLTITTGV